MKQILAFGDSLTWGADPSTGERHPFEQRWSTSLERELKSAAQVIPEGLGGRTTCFDDHAAPNERNAVKALPMLLASHYPLDLVIIMLGTNDLKPQLCGFANGAQGGMRRLVQLVQLYPWKSVTQVPKILIVAPPPCRLTGDGRPPAQNRSIEESRKFSPLYTALAKEMATGFFDAGTVAEASAEDGVHLHAEDSCKLGIALATPVRTLLDI
ncbi:SGNH/GDSL hydrolase family protein [Rhizobium skierniewicense]|uniref:SGNH/GDSL hydrolase family protein n=1 Tax=Rhizobium skierniewicense TaxID=984260 RepID=UPI001574787E|nr:SGNH/GDSL hydrolase family protein [Rhizobium skierniewicense]NTF33445.1 SGNH/GDSL hydrolase family protein [Rhizobium skierniewicense]